MCAPVDPQTQEFVGERCDLACGRCRIGEFGDQAAGLRGGGEGDALADGGGEQRWIVIGQGLGGLAGQDGARTAAIEHEAGDQFRAMVRALPGLVATGG